MFLCIILLFVITLYNFASEFAEVMEKKGKKISDSQGCLLYVAALALVFIAISVVNSRRGELDMTVLVLPAVVAGAIIYYIIRRIRQKKS